MADKQCPQCSETVDEAKAFCPACGHSFVEEEERRDSRNYDLHDHTMQMGETMYNAMLSDMGLNVSKSPNKQTEVERQVIVQPATGVQAAGPAGATPEQPKKSNTKIWMVTIAVALALILLLAVAVVAVAIYLYLQAGKV